MKELLELARVVTSYRLDKVSAFNVYNRQLEQSMYNKFFEGILKKEFSTDVEASKKLYGTEEKNAKYRILKQRLKERIYNNVLFIDSGKRASSRYNRALHSLYRHHLVARFLIGVGAKASGYDLMHKVVKKARKFQLHDIVQQCALQFRQQSMLEGDPKKYQTYSKLFIDANEKLAAEAQAEGTYHNLGLVLNNTQSIPKDLIQQAKDASELSTSLRGKTPTYQTYFYEYNIHTVYFQLIGDYRSAIDACNKFQNYLNKNSIFDTKLRRGKINLIKASCYLQMQEYKNGIVYAEQGLKQYTVGVYNWFMGMEIYFLLLLNSNKLKKATEVYNDAIEQERFSYLPQQNQETWKIFGGYLFFMLNRSAVGTDAKSLEERDFHFKYGKMLNEIPHHSRDKKGMNVAVLILQVLLLLENKNYVEIISRTEALKNYSYRNLARENALRSHYFIRMLMIMEQCQFNKAKIKRRTTYLFKKMKSSDLNYTRTQARMEIISYETLWDTVLEMLD